MDTIKNYNKVRYAQATCYLLVIWAITLHFSWTLLFIGLALGWTLFLIGLGVSLHKYCSHRALQPRNNVVQHLLLYLGTLCTLGTPLEFAAGHRTHHKYSDTDQDPFVLTDSIWNNIKVWFLWVDTTKINARIIIDLMRNPTIKFYHQHYWKIWLPLPIILLVINPVIMAYCFALPVVYVLLGMSYVTVIAHSKWCQRIFGVKGAHGQDNKSWNSALFTVLFPGEGHHESHHHKPGERNYSRINGRWDFGSSIADIFSKYDKSASIE